jgi:hypothetical protein
MKASGEETALDTVQVYTKMRCGCVGLHSIQLWLESRDDGTEQSQTLVSLNGMGSQQHYVLQQ